MIQRHTQLRTVEQAGALNSSAAASPRPQGPLSTSSSLPPQQHPQALTPGEGRAHHLLQGQLPLKALALCTNRPRGRRREGREGGDR